MKILDTFRNRSKQKESTIYNQSDNTNSFDESLDSLINGELPFGWCSYNEKLIKEMENPIPKYAVASNQGSIDDQIHTLQDMITHYENFRFEFYSRGECFKKYFQDHWEHVSNSQYEDCDFIDVYKEKLRYLLENYDSLVEKERRYNELTSDLEERVYFYILNNNGVLQTDLYKAFDILIKQDIQNLLYYWEKSGKIKRIKTGRTYKILI
jgi:hypothetical protein